MIETKKIITKDYYGDNCLADGFVDKTCPTERHPQGLVEIYEVTEDGKEQLVSKSNLVVFQGREIIAQRMLGVDNGFIASTKDETISWFGIGQGGVNVGDPFNPSPPTSVDTDLSIEVPISSVDPSCGDLRGGFYYKKPIETVEFEQDTYNENSWLIVKTISRVSVTDAVGSHISEAALFASDGGPIAGYSGPFHMFSKVTFPTLVKTNTRQLLFIWYLYF